MLPTAETEVFLGVAPGQRRMSNLDLGEKLNVACLRRTNAAAIDQFVAVIEPYRTEAFIESIDRIEAQGRSPETVVLRVRQRGQTDWILSNPSGQHCAAVVADRGELRTDAVFCVVSLVRGELRRAYLVCGSRLSLGAYDFSVGPSYTGKLLSFDDERDTLTVAAESPLPTADRLLDETIIIRHARGTSTFTVESIRRLDGPRHEIALRWSPHLGENYLRVVRSGGAWLHYQPPHSLPFRCAELGYHVYEKSNGGPLKHIGRIAAATHSMFFLDSHERNVTAGDEIVVTRLRPGHDSFFIARSLLVTEGNGFRVSGVGIQ